MQIKRILAQALTWVFLGCNTLISPEEKTDSPVAESQLPFVWEAANIYFLLTDRFNNGDPSNDVNFGRTLETG